MHKLYPLSFLLSFSVSALAQQPDTLAPRRVGVLVAADSLPILPKAEAELPSFIDSVPGVRIEHSSNLLPYLALQEQLRQVAGVQATPYSGAPGAQVAVRIRGAASLSHNAQPLYVVDGVPVFQHTFSLPSSSSTPGFVSAEAAELDLNPLLSLPTEDIESVEVIRGALGTARYGSQGLNGVISITTRRGRTGPLRVRYAGYGGVQRTRRPYELLNAEQYAMLANEAALNAGRPAPYSAAQVAGFGEGTNWQDALLRIAAVQKHHLSAQGGKARTRYYTSADYLGQAGVVLGSRLSRYAARAAVEQGIGEKWHLRVQVGISQTTQRRPLHNTLEWALISPPTVPIRQPDGTFTTDPLGPNAVQLAEEHYQTPRQRRLLTQASAQYLLLPGLTADLRVNLERAALRSETYVPAFGPLPGGRRAEYEATYRQWVVNPALRYHRSLPGGRHVLDATFEAFRQSRTVEEAYTISLPPPSGGLPMVGGSTSGYQAAVKGYRLEADYTWSRRYQVQGSLRRDASSTFEPDNQWEWLPGTQLTWHAGQEAFLQGQSIVEQLEVWVGWGRTSGAGNVGRNFTLIPLANFPNLGNRAVVFLREPTRQLEAGVSATLWQSRLQATAAAYSRRTNAGGQLGPRQFGQENQVRNRGLELTLAGSWQAGPVTGTTRVAAAANQNRVRLPVPFFGRYGSQPTLDGQALSTFQGYRYLGVSNSGEPNFEDRNGDGRLGFEDQQALGSGLPRQLLSLGQQVTFRRFSLQAQLDGQFGYQVYNQLLSSLDEPSGFSNGTTRLLSRWTPTNQNTSVPAANQRLQLPLLSTYTLQSGNHVRLTSLTLTYKVWEKDARNFSVWMGGHNLLVLTKYRGFDPNISSAGSDNQQAGLEASTYPTARTVMVGVQATL